MRKAYGAHRKMTVPEKARNVAESMIRFQEDGEAKDLSFYGISEESEVGTLVLTMLACKVSR